MPLVAGQLVFPVRSADGRTMAMPFQRPYGPLADYSLRLNGPSWYLDPPIGEYPEFILALSEEMLDTDFTLTLNPAIGGPRQWPKLGEDINDIYCIPVRSHDNHIMIAGLWPLNETDKVGIPVRTADGKVAGLRTWKGSGPWEQWPYLPQFIKVTYWTSHPVTDVNAATFPVTYRGSAGSPSYPWYTSDPLAQLMVGRNLASGRWYAMFRMARYWHSYDPPSHASWRDVLDWSCGLGVSPPWPERGYNHVMLAQVYYAVSSIDANLARVIEPNTDEECNLIGPITWVQNDFIKCCGQWPPLQMVGHKGVVIGQL